MLILKDNIWKVKQTNKIRWLRQKKICIQWNLKTTEGWSLKHKIWWIGLNWDKMANVLRPLNYAKMKSWSKWTYGRTRMAMVLFTGRHLEVGACDVANIDRVKNWIMKYHWSEDILFFYNITVHGLKERKMLIKKVHGEIQHFNKMRTLANTNKQFF